MPIKLLSRMKIGHSMNLAAIHEPHAYEVYVVQRELEKIQDQLQQTNTGDIMLNSTPNRSDNSSSSQQPLIVNTSSFNKEDLHNYINVSEEIDRRQLLRRLSHPTPLQATMTREEIFECSTLEDDNFLTALEFQNSYRPRQITDLDLSQSMENVLSYFDEDVNVDSCRSNCDTPTRLPPAGTVAAAIAHFQTDLSPPPPYYEDHATAQPPQYVNIQELRKKYEPIGANGVEKPNQTLRATQSLPPRPPQLKPRKYSPVLVHPLPPKSPKLSRKSRVMQMAQMFNAKISQLMRRDVKEKSYAPLQNEFSPDHLKPMHKIAAVKPLPKPRVKKPVYRTGCVLPSPKPSPRFRRKQVVPQPPAHEHELVQSARQQPYNSSDKACLVAEDVFRQLSVKDKALLYNKFIEDMSRQHPQFSVHARVVEATVQQELARGEAAAERQRVKEIARQLEAKFNLPKPKISAWALKRLAHLQKSSEFVGDKRRSPTPPPVIAAALQRAEEETDANAVDEDEEEELHVSTLTVVLKPSPEKQTTPKQRSVFRQLPRKQREQRFINDMRNIEVARKRNNETMRTSFSFDVYGPPKKIRRTRAERMHPREIFQNTHMERLFYSWLMEKNGVTFDITTVENSDASLSPVLDRQEREDAKGIENDKTSLQTLLDKAEAKLNKELVKKETFTKEEDEAIQQLITAMDAAKISDCDEKVTSKPTKRSAPLAPEQQSNIASSASSCGKLSDAESEAGLSSLPKPPENELQKSHDHNPAALSEHQLRVQASLQRLNIPDWFRQYNQNTSRSPDGSAGGSAYKPGNFTRKRTTESGRWAGLNSKTTSLSSLGSQRSDRSPLLLSPSAHSHHGGQSTLAAHQHASGTGAAGGTHGGGAGAFSRWSTSHLNSSQTSPSVSQRGSFTRGGPINSSFMSVASGQSNVIRSSFRQPYLGWRSQEKLSQRTPHERLASSLLAQQQRTSPTQRTPNATNGNNGGKLQPVTPEIQSSIKEVTSAIVHYVNDQTNQQRSRSTSPNSRKCWLESSFVGIRPLDSPQTPIIESNTTNTFGSANNSCSSSNQYNNYNYAYNYNYNNTSNSSVGTTSSFHSTAAAASATAPQAGGVGITTAITTNPHVLRMNGLSIVGGAPERSLSSASLEDVLASLLGLPSSSAGGVGVGASTGAGPSSSTSDPYARSTTGDSASQGLSTFRHMPQQQQQLPPPQQQPHLPTTKLSQLQVNQLAEQQRLRRRSEGDAPTQQKQQQQQQQLQLLNQNAKSNSTPGNTNASAANSGDVNINTATSSGPGTGTGTGPCIGAGNATIPPRRVSVGDSSESNNKTTSELQIKCRNTKCDRSATPADAKKYYKSCHNCTHLYCSRECRRAHWEKHRKACLHSRASNLCRQVLATCKDDVDSQRHLSLLARKGFLSQGRGVVRVLFRSAEAAESFIKHGFQCMGEASYVRWPDLMPAEMGLELYSELLKLSTEYKPDSKMLIYVAICVVSEAPGMGQAPVRWERQLVSRCAKLKLCKSILAELEQQHQSSSTQLQQCAILQQQSQLAIVNVPEPTTEILILTFNPTLRTNAGQGELILTNILDILSRRGVLLRKHYPEIYQRLQTFTDGQTDKFNPVTLHPRDSQTGKSFVCIIMPVHSTEREVIKLPSASDGGNRVTTIDVGSPAALAQLDDDELLTRSAS